MQKPSWSAAKTSEYSEKSLKFKFHQNYFVQAIELESASVQNYF